MGAMERLQYTNHGGLVISEDGGTYFFNDQGLNGALIRAFDVAASGEIFALAEEGLFKLE